MECGFGDTTQSAGTSVGNPFHMDTSDKIGGENDCDLNPFADSPTQSPVLQKVPSNSNSSPSNPAKGQKGDIMKIPEPENMIKWRKDRQKFLDEQDAAEYRRKEEMADLARSQYETWFENYNAVVEKTKAANRKAHEQFTQVDSIEKQKIGFIAPGGAFLSRESEDLSVWECVAKLCDLGPNNRNIKSDVNRMRQLMLQLKGQKFSKPNKTSTQ